MFNATRFEFVQCSISATMFLVFFLIGGFFFGHYAVAQPPTVHGKRIINTLELARDFHRQSEALPKNVSLRVEKKKQLYVSMAAKLKVPGDFDHLPFPEQSNEEWKQSAETVAKGLKLNVNYQVVKGNAEDAVVCINEQIAENLNDNVRLIAWYRDRLGVRQTTSQFGGSLELGRLIDQYFGCLSKSLPEVKVRKYGSMNVSRQQKITFSNTDIWGILAIINRYFFYKSQIVGSSQRQTRADFLLVESMANTAAIYGAEPPNSNLGRIEVELNAKKTGWREAGYNALESWNDVIKQPQVFDENLVTIHIPAKPKTAPSPSKKTNNFPNDVEDIKEIGGKLFIKRKGNWQPWPPK